MPPHRSEPLERLFSPHPVRVYTAEASDRFVPSLEESERAPTAAMSPGRVAEYATGRACAHAALAEFALDAPVGRLDGGAPVWPTHAIGSISHTKGYVLAAAARRENVEAIGIDVEEVGRLSPAVERRILIDTERRRLHGLTEADRQTVVAVTFAAKEAFYKAHYQIDARYIGFDVVAVSVQPDGRASFEIASAQVDPAIIDRTRAAYSIRDGRVTVGVAISAEPAP